MADLLLRQKLAKHRTLCVSELSKDTLAEQGSLDWSGPMTGLFLYVLDERPVVGGITVLASLACPDAAFHLFDLLAAKMAPQRRSAPRSRRRSRSRQDGDMLAAFP